MKDPNIETDPWKYQNQKKKKKSKKRENHSRYL